MNRIPLFLSQKIARSIAEHLPYIEERLKGTFPSLKRNLELLDIDVNDGEYILMSAVNALAMGLIFSIIAFILLTLASKEAVLPLTLITFVVMTLLFFAIYLVYPGVLVRKIAEEMDAQLLYAINDMVMHVTAGTSLFEAIKRIARGNYGAVSEEFRKVVEEVISGSSQEAALIKVAKESKSEFARRVFWQLATVLHTGSSLKKALQNISSGIREYQTNRIKEYSQSLNLYILIFMIVSVVIPSLAMLVFAAFSIIGTVQGMGSVNLGTIPLYLIGGIIIAEILIIEYVRARRPKL